MKKAKTMQVKQQRGFTLIEMMMTIAIAAILATIAVPSFMNQIRMNRITTATNELVSSLALARSEASKRGVRVSICARNGANCTNTTSWTNGWIVFTDANANGSLDVGTDQPINVTSITASNVSITASISSFTYEVSGESASATTFSVTTSGCGVGQKRIVTASLNGRVSVSKQDC